MARKPGASDEEQFENITAVAEVGGVTAYRLKRDLGITRIDELAETDVETLQEIWGVGEYRAKVMIGSAQGHTEATVGQNEHRVAVIAGEDEFDGLDGEIVQTVIDEALAKADVTVDSRTRIGYVTDGMGGDRISVWYDKQRMAIDGVRKQPFETPWDKYAKIIDPDRFVDDNEAPTRPNIDNFPKLKTDIPFDLDRYEDVEWRHAPMERTRNVVKWADEVVIVADGDYARQFRWKCDQLDVDCTTVFDIDRSGSDPKLKLWEPPKEHNVDTNQPESDATYLGGDGPRWGSPDDLDRDDALTMEPNDSLDQRPEVEDGSAGEGVGSANYSEWISPGR